jgi:glycosyltransferase involved in cell wall biosynthesis
MPVYNCEEFLKNSVSAVLSQSYLNIELIVVNDGSTDRSDDILKQFVNKIRYITTTNKGVSHARNIGIEQSTGDWIAFCDADDEWFNDKIERQISAIGDSYWSYTDSYYVGLYYKHGTKRSDLSKLYDGLIFDELCFENLITTSSVLIKKSVLKEFGKFNENSKALEDWELWLKIARKYPIKLVDKPLLNYRVYPGSASRDARMMLPLHLDLIENVFFEKNRLKAKNKSLVKANLICSYIAEQGKDYKFALYCIVNAIKLTPLSLTLYKRFISIIWNWFAKR